LNWKKIIISTFATGLVLLSLWIAWSTIVPMVFPNYDPMTLPGMRAVNDPVMGLFYLYPFIVALAFSITFHFVGHAFERESVHKQGIHFGLLMWLLITLPLMYMIYTTMTYGETFLLTNTIGQLVDFSIAGIVIANVFARR